MRNQLFPVTALTCALALVGFGPVTSTWCQEKPVQEKPAQAKPPAGGAAPGKSLDDDLLDQLTEGLDLGPARNPGKKPDPEKPAPEKPTPEKPTPEKPGDKPPADPPLPEESDDPEAVGASGGQASPLLKIGKQMRDVQQRLKAADGGDNTQSTQTEIVNQLTEMLKLKQAQAQKNSQKAPTKQQQQQANRNKPQVPQAGQPMGTQPGDAQPMGPDKPSDKPTTDSTDRVGQDAQKPRDPFQQLSNFLEAEWGNLPERDRNMVLQAFREKFLPQYDGLIRAYYDELSRSDNERLAK